MAGTARMLLMMELMSVGSHARFPRSDWLEMALAIDEGSVDGPLTLANGASGVAIPGIGTGATDITTLSVFGLFAYGTISLVWNGGSAITLNGSVANPAVFVIGRTSNMEVPLVSNASGADVMLFVVKAGS